MDKYEKYATYLAETTKNKPSMHPKIAKAKETLENRGYEVTHKGGELNAVHPDNEGRVIHVRTIEGGHVRASVGDREGNTTKHWHGADDKDHALMHDQEHEDPSIAVNHAVKWAHSN